MILRMTASQSDAFVALFLTTIAQLGITLLEISRNGDVPKPTMYRWMVRKTRRIPVDGARELISTLGRLAEQKGLLA